MMKEFLYKNKTLFVYFFILGFLGIFTTPADWFLRTYWGKQFSSVEFATFAKMSLLLSSSLSYSTLLMNIIYCSLTYRISRNPAWSILALLLGSMIPIVFYMYCLLNRKDIIYGVDSHFYRFNMRVGLFLIAIHLFILIPNPIMFKHVLEYLYYPYLQGMTLPIAFGYVKTYIFLLPYIGFGTFFFLQVKKDIKERFFWALTAYTAPLEAAILWMMISLLIERRKIQVGQNDK